MRNRQSASPGNDSIGAYQHGTQTQLLFRPTGNIFDAIIHRFRGGLPVEVEQKPFARAHQLTNGCTVLQLEVGRAATYQRMTVTQIVPRGYTPYPPREVSGTVASIHQ